jgi:hypothetical protein
VFKGPSVYLYLREAGNQAVLSDAEARQLLPQQRLFDDTRAQAIGEGVDLAQY